MADTNNGSPAVDGKQRSALTTGETTEFSSEAPSQSWDKVHSDNGHTLVQRTWRTRFFDQSSALIYKQCLVYARNLRATVLRLLAPLFFMFLLWLIDLAIKADNVNLDSFSNNPNPAVTAFSAVPACSTNVYMQLPCWDFMYSPNDSAVVDQIVNGIRANNGDRPIDPSSVLGFASIADANAFMLENPERALGALHFLLPAAGASNIDYVLQSNFSVKFFKNRFQDPTFFAAVPLQVAAEREIARYQWEAAGRTDPLQWEVSASQFAHPTTGSVNIVGQAIGPFIFAANCFNFVLLLSSIVSERERGLRQALTTAGMLDSARWASWLVVELTISVFFTLLIIACGAMFGFGFFLHNSILVIFLLFLMFQWAMVGLAFVLSAFLAKSSSAINLGFVIFILGWIVQATIAFDFPYTPKYVASSRFIVAIFTLMPWGPLAKAAIDLGAAGEETQDGITWSRRSSYCQDVSNPGQVDALYATAPGGYWDFDCAFPVGTAITILFIEFVAYTLLAVYLDNVVPNENGVRKKAWYPCSPGYWCGRGGTKGGHSSVSTSRGVRRLSPPVPCPVDEGTTDPDVAAAEAAMRDLLEHRSGSADALALEADRSNAVEVYGLQKAFGRKLCGRGGRCCSCFACCGATSGKAQKGAAFWAIKGSWFAIERGQLFCLLGPNGAGKTTTINCLTGAMPPTGGDALVYGESITAPGGLDRIRAVMGVCPQFDVLWGELTGAEHLYIYGRIKGLSKAAVAAESDRLLDAVKLMRAAKQRTAAYSGGMRRRLSVAISLLGDPLILYLDEPTTGMDPISRRQVWDAIEAAKPGRAIVLTTHSMEEADILGDAVAIMARGRVRAFGSSLRLKQRFGSGYQLAVAVEGAKGGAGGLSQAASAADLAAVAGANGSAAATSVPAATSTVSAAAAAAAGAKAASVQKRVAAVQARFWEELGVTAGDGSSGAYLQFVVPKAREGDLPGFLRRLEQDRAALGITDVQISLTSLEEVFLSIAKAAELEAAAAEGREDLKVTLEDGSTLEVPLGEEFVVQKGTDITYEIKWAQDEHGKLQVLSWTAVAGGPGPGAGAPLPAAAATATVAPAVADGMPRV